MQQRLGNKVLRQRLRGPALAAYYPRRSATVEDVLKEFKRFDLEGFNEEEDDRLENVAFAKLRGKGAPKKKRTAAGTIYLVSRPTRY
jgi:small subunit ribosomal protein S33